MAEQTSKADRVKLNRELAQMLKGGVIMDVTTPEQARIAEEAGACAVMALERIPADIRAAGGVSRMSDPKMIKGIQEAVSIPVMAKCRIGHIVEAQVLQAIEIDYIDESEVLSPADDVYHIDKTQFDVPFVCGARDLGEALRRVAEGATMIRTKGEPGTATSSKPCATCARFKSKSATLLLCAMTSSLRQLSNCKFQSSLCARSMPRQASRGELCRRRCSNPRGRRADDAAGCRGRLCRLGHL